ncbi:MAG: hypothetical protein C0508_23580, partial [Cyanobacteria bacterium PR.023]|jgi:hypothetical protein|nr:hypothetical protein [Cyanobacteria bacterium PR.023]MDO9621661.1 hypothetical protein [Moraxellaceae bacterium]MDP1540285.1 hypothetical protein [Moraxellaceae bacterium]MDP1776275.1 hypothetical protein [Moraxellaceae bacterium]MDZ4298235.1 hypothetical protein [Moraxellaceae bacterium]
MNLQSLFNWLLCLPRPRDATKATEIDDVLRKLEGCVAGYYIEVRTKHIRLTVQTDDLFNPTVQVFIKKKAVPLTASVLEALQELVARDYAIKWRTTVAP